MGELNPGNLNRIVTPQSFAAMLRDTLSDDPHLTDAELIELGTGLIDPESEQSLLEHLKCCAHCSGELEGVRASLSPWENPSILQRLEERIGRPAVMAETVEKPWWSSLAQLTPLSIFRSGLSASASPASDIGVVHFPIHAGSEAVVGLSGVVQRRGQAYYVHLTASPGLMNEYQARQVEVVLIDPESGRSLINRKATFDHFVLLGTDLEIGTHKIAARLLP
jgi:hypothetical protein